MPINVSYIENQIYRGEWIGDITIEEVIHKMKETSVLATEHGNDKFVLIIDLTQVGTIPFDLLNLRNIADSDHRVACYVVVKAPLVGQILGKMLNNVSSKNFIFTDSLEEAIQVGEGFIKTHDEEMI